MFCWEDGRPPHPDTITRRFKKQYVQTDLEADRQGGQHARGADHRRVTDLVRDHWDGLRGGVNEPEVYKSVYKPHAEGPFPVQERASGLGSGGGI